MWNFSNIREKIAINCGLSFLEKKISLNENNKTKTSYKIYSLQDLYDLSGIKNGTNLDSAATLIHRAQKVKFIVNREDENIKNLILEIAKAFELLGINVSVLFPDADNSKLEENDVIIRLVLNDDSDNMEPLSSLKKRLNLKIINIFFDKNRGHNERDINLYCLHLKNIDALLSLEILLKCLYLGVLAKV